MAGRRFIALVARIGIDRPIVHPAGFALKAAAGAARVRELRDRRAHGARRAQAATGCLELHDIDFTTTTGDRIGTTLPAAILVALYGTFW